MAKKHQRPKQVTTKKESRTPAPLPEHGDELISWSVTPVLKDKRRGYLLAICVLAFAALVYIAYRDWFWPAMTVILSGISFSSFLLPNNYRLTTEGVVFKNGVSTLFKPWKGFMRYRVAADGVYLVFRKTVRTRILGAGIFIYFGDNNKEQVIDIITANMGQVPTIDVSNTEG